MSRTPAPCPFFPRFHFWFSLFAANKLPNSEDGKDPSEPLNYGHAPKAKMIFPILSRRLGVASSSAARRCALYPAAAPSLLSSSNPHPHPQLVVNGENNTKRWFVFAPTLAKHMPIKKVELMSLGQVGRKSDSASSEASTPVPVQQGTLQAVTSPKGSHVIAGDVVVVVETSDGARVEIRAPQSGQIVSVAKELNAAVTLGDCLFEIDTDTVDIATQDFERLANHIQSNQGILQEEWFQETFLGTIDDIGRLKKIAVMIRDGMPRKWLPKSLNVLGRILELQQEQKETTPGLEVAQTATDIGIVLRLLGDLEGAVVQLEYALNIRIEALGDTHPEVAASHIYLGATLNQNPDQFTKSLEHFQKALEIQITHVGKDHAVVATSHANLGATYFQNGLYDDALKHYLSALEIHQTNNKETPHVDTASALQNVGIAKKHTGDFKGAMEHCQAALEMRLHLNPHSAETAASHSSMGQLCSELGQTELAMEHYNKTLVIYESVHGPKSLMTAAAIQNLGAIYYQTKDYERALVEYRKGLLILQDVLPMTHPDLAAAWNNVGLSLHQQGKSDEALDAHLTARYIIEGTATTLGPDTDQHPHANANLNLNLATTIGCIGNVYKYQEKFDQALEEFELAHSLLVAHLGEDHPDVASSHNNRGLVFVQLGRLDQALTCYKDARRAFAASLGDSHPHTGSCHYNIGLVLQEQGDYQNAAMEYELSRLIWSSCLGLEHPHTLQAAKAKEEVEQEAKDKEPSST
jgi:tetratricopeptide (TPR) repeat protein/biotin carboxyl carrier protein